jgi:hypothetical protein
MRYNFRALAGAAIVAGCLSLISAVPAQAGVLDCTVSPGTCTGGTATGIAGLYSFAGALWTTSDFQATGSGVIDSFVRISDNADIVSGMNTDARPLPQDENSSPTFTKDINASAVPVVQINAGAFTGLYYEFLLDINQQGVDPLLSLNLLSVCVSDTGDQTISGSATTCAGAGAAGAGDLVYNLDTILVGGTDNTVNLNYNFNSGSGSGDLFVYIPVSALVNSPGDFIYLYSSFGAPHNNNDGGEEWAVRTTSTPTQIPDGGATLTLLGLALSGIGVARRFMNS